MNQLEFEATIADLESLVGSGGDATEDRSHWSTDDLGTWFLPRRTTAGVPVNHKTAQTFVAFYAAVDLISRDVAKLPLITYMRLANGGRAEAPSHDVYKLLKTQPNPEQTSFIFRQTLMGWVLSWGNGYAEIQRRANGKPFALWPIAVPRVRIERNKEQELIYRIDGDKGVRLGHERMGQGGRAIPARDMLHVRMAGDGIIGKSPVTLFAETIGLGLAQQRSEAAFYGNGATPGGILSHPSRLSDKAAKRLASEWKKRHGGPTNAREVAVLEEGMAWTSVGPAQKDAQTLASRQFSVVEVARIFHIPPHKLQELTRATFSNITDQSLDWVQNGLMGWLVNWEQEANSKLFLPREQNQFFAEFNVNGLLRGDSTTRFAGYRTARETGWMSINEIRRLENMNPLPPEIGDVYLASKNFVPAEKLGEETDAARSWLINELTRVMRAEEKGGGKPDQWARMLWPAWQACGGEAHQLSEFAGSVNCNGWGVPGMLGPEARAQTVAAGILDNLRGAADG